MRRTLTVVLFGLLFTACAFSQAFTGSISGLVSDPTGALLTDAKITITDVAKNTHYTTSTNESGFYLIGQLAPSAYRVTAEKPGFRKHVLDEVPLSTQQKVSADIAMELGSISENVQVTAQAQLIESTTSTLGAVVENKRIVDLPLNGRNILNLSALVPGVFLVRQMTGIADTFTANRFIVNGGQESTSDMILDGVSATVSHNIATIPAVSAIPSVEGIQEFKIQTNAYSAEYGRSGGGVVTLVTKSGTNELHGSVFEFLRNSFFDANNFFANKAGRALTIQTQPVWCEHRPAGLRSEAIQRPQQNLFLHALRGTTHPCRVARTAYGADRSGEERELHAKPHRLRPDEGDLRSDHHARQPGSTRPVHTRPVPG